MTISLGPTIPAYGFMFGIILSSPTQVKISSSVGAFIGLVVGLLIWYVAAWMNGGDVFMNIGLVNMEGENE